MMRKRRKRRRTMMRKRKSSRSGSLRVSLSKRWIRGARNLVLRGVGLRSWRN
jgi:hypothetical protein